MTTPDPLPQDPPPQDPLPQDPPGPRTFVARDPADVLAVVPVVLGFEPCESIVMLTFGAERQFHARLDLPCVDAPDEQVHAASELLVQPAVQHGADAVLLVVYTDDAERSRRSARSLVDAFGAAGVRVLSALRADGRRYWPAAGPGEGTAYDVSAHPVRAQAVLDGRVTHRSRDELAATLTTDRAARDDVAGAVEHEPPLDGEQVAELLARCVPAGLPARAEEVAGLVQAMADPVVRDVAWLVMTRDEAADHVVFWSDVVRRTPDAWLPGAAAVLGFAAWLSGSGALAWCAVDRCLGADPGHVLGGYVARLLERAVAPHAWSPAVLPA